MDFEAAYLNYAAARQEKMLLRVLKESEPLGQGKLRRDGRVLINFAGNDYLGLSHHPALIAAAKRYAEAFGTGSAASRLVTGNLSCFSEIEEKLAAGKGKEAALILAAGYQTNLTVLAALADKDVLGRKVTILADRLIHNSLLQGALLSGARLARFHHNDLAHLETLLARESENAVIIVSESVFGMDGDVADLAALGALAKRFGAMLYIDEAHATGLFGKNGFGLAADCPDLVDIVMGTFGKALGSFGSYIACSKAARDFLVQRCGGLVYSTALPPQVLGSIAAAIDLVPTLEAERAHLETLSQRLREGLVALGFDCGASATQIVPVIIGDEARAMAMVAALEEQGFLAAAIRPPTVPQGTARLRLSLSAAHQTEDIDAFLSVMAGLQ
ncbi:8-amino-7-oxononanoate synthase [Rhizomicrobium palustre]|uniref:8-amino-7-oxononanoate synthase n=2 Tax=Rhizomicrobium palustre TaxID=189966 RepID=A0A846MZK0_9PROT|nr:8-amino-7-oxononanoate synthase [Rhizomicrobium palustre]NIK89094.1 8-amino-7-oxononanoate synthase [Rhizomicrobium palustre]